ncbi:hypothetical protein C4559_04795 [Candidatus Microgenomates bacterium]|nr:MAG: hypothetical protein C4559_04795 [Candidatus Microgenomates bacterium]
MNTVLIFAWVYLAMIAMSFWEAAVEGSNAWDKGKNGWKIKFGKYCFTSYHFFIFFIMWPLMLTLPLVINGWDVKLFGVLASAYFSGIALEDIMWFAVNPKVELSDFNPKFANYYPWIKIGKISIPLMHTIGIALSILCWYFIWR